MDPNKLDVDPLMNDQMKAVVAKSAELAGPFETNVSLDVMRAN